MGKGKSGVRVLGVSGALAVAIFAPVMAMAAASDAGGTEDPAVLGRLLAEEQCGACHAIGKDDESAAEGAPAFRDLDKRYPVDQLEEALAEGIVTGHEGMPEIEWEAEEVANFIAYLKTLTD